MALYIRVDSLHLNQFEPELRAQRLEIKPMINVFSMIAAAALFVCAVVDLRQQRFVRATLLAAVAAANLIFVASSL